jgi:hypothetical protein
MRLTLIALLLAGVAGCDATPADNPGRPVEESVSEFDSKLKAAEQGDAEAQWRLGLMYEFGEGVAQDYAEARRWYRKAAEQGNADAQNSLGINYTTGYGVPKDLTEAYAWMAVAATNGHTLAKKNLLTTKVELTPDQLTAAEKRAAELTKQINANKAD